MGAQLLRSVSRLSWCCSGRIVRSGQKRTISAYQNGENASPTTSTKLSPHLASHDRIWFCLRSSRSARSWPRMTQRPSISPMSSICRTDSFLSSETRAKPPTLYSLPSSTQDVNALKSNGDACPFELDSWQVPTCQCRPETRSIGSHRVSLDSPSLSFCVSRGSPQANLRSLRSRSGWFSGSFSPTGRCRLPSIWPATNREMNQRASGTGRSFVGSAVSDEIKVNGTEVPARNLNPEMNLELLAVEQEWPDSITETLFLPRLSPACCAFNRRGNYLALGGNEGQLAVWDLEATRSAARILRPHHGARVNSVRCGP